MKRPTAAARTSQGIEDLTEDQKAEVERVLSILCRLRRGGAAMRNSLAEGVYDDRAWERFCFGEE